MITREDINAAIAKLDAECETAAQPVITPEVNLAAMLSELACQIAFGRFGDVEACVVFVRGQKSAAIVTLPQEPVEDTARRLDAAKHYLLTGELPT